MKKKRLMIAIAVLLAILVVPVSTGTDADGETKTYSALTYKIVKWNKSLNGEIYQKNRVYFLPDCFKSIDTLWEQEADKVEKNFRAVVVEFDGSTAVVKPLENEEEYQSSEQIKFCVDGFEETDIKVGSIVEVSYLGGIKERFPVAINAVSWKISKDFRPMTYTEEWLDKDTAEKGEDIFSDVIITEIYADCFFAQPVIPMPYQIKLNGTLSDDWCVGDQVAVTSENLYYDEKSQRVEGDLLTVEPSDFELQPGVCYKPVIYLYPQKETDVAVYLTVNGELTCTYPTYQNGWYVKALPDGTLIDGRNQEYRYLY